MSSYDENKEINKLTMRINHTLKTSPVTLFCSCLNLTDIFCIENVLLLFSCQIQMYYSVKLQFLNFFAIKNVYWKLLFFTSLTYQNLIKEGKSLSKYCRGKEKSLQESMIKDFEGERAPRAPS